MIDYIAVSTLVTDRIFSPEGVFLGSYPGGAGAYAFSGMRVWSKSSTLLTGVGADYMDLYGSWLKASFIQKPLLAVRSPNSPISNVRYSEDGTRTEIPEYGSDHYQSMEASSEEIVAAIRMHAPKGMYIFKEAIRSFWDPIFHEAENNSVKICWEINADSAKPEHLDAVRQIARECKMFSLNHEEGKQLFGTSDQGEIMQSLQGWNIPLVYFRVGKSGAFLITKEEILMSPSCDGVQVVDPTGAGNSSTAAVLTGFCEQLPISECGRRGSMSAARCIEQFGPPSTWE